MSSEIWDPFKEMKKTFNHFFSNKLTFPKLRDPLVNITEKANMLIAKVEIPDVDKKDLQVTVSQEKVELKAEKKSELRQEKKNVIQKEESYTGFYKSFKLPKTVDPDQTKMEYDKGILTLTMPIVKREKKKKHLKIK